MFNQDTSKRLGILLVQLGTPDAPTTSAVRRYLAEFLWDPKVIELPRLLWWFVLHGIILRTRPKHAARLYQKIWTEQGSPLLVISNAQRIALENKLREKTKKSVSVYLGMRYGNPSLKDVLEEIRKHNIDLLFILPLYPQYATATTGSAFDSVANLLSKWRKLPELHMVMQYHDYSSYLDALATSVEEAWQKHLKPEKLLFSFHGLPIQATLVGDPYEEQCHATARGVAERLQLKENEWTTSFQSRVGPATWLQPYTDETLEKWAKTGIQRVDVFCPGFSADCLETLEEVQLRYRDLFLSAGGKTYHFILSLNDRPDHIDALADLILNRLCLN
ncbi:Ferrochelatase [Gammaproteobacteria bacterium]